MLRLAGPWEMNFTSKLGEFRRLLEVHTDNYGPGMRGECDNKFPQFEIQLIFFLTDFLKNHEKLYFESFKK